MITHFLNNCKGFGKISSAHCTTSETAHAAQIGKTRRRTDFSDDPHRLRKFCWIIFLHLLTVASPCPASRKVGACEKTRSVTVDARSARRFRALPLGRACAFGAKLRGRELRACPHRRTYSSRPPRQYKNKTQPMLCSLFGCPWQTRTVDTAVNSRMLYRS